MKRNRPAENSRPSESNQDINPFKQCPRCKSKILWFEPILSDQRYYSFKEGLDIVCNCGHRTLVQCIKKKGEIWIGETIHNAYTLDYPISKIGILNV